MILHTFFSQSHKPLFDYYFYPSIKDTDIKIVFDTIPQECSGVYMKDNWNKAMLRKLSLCKKLAMGTEIFVHSDADVQFFRPIKPDVEEILKDADIAFQHDGQDFLCAGLFCAKPSKNLEILFETAIELVYTKIAQNDQHALNIILKNADCPLVYKKMPETWWSQGADTFSLYDGHDVNPPPNIVAHHANWVEGVMPKMALLEKVKRKVYGIS